MKPTYEDIRPVRMADGLYFIGARPVSVHVIDTGAGLILLDTGYPYMLSGILSHLDALGLSVRNVRYILHTHGHYDHIGCTKRLVAMSGARTMIGAPDRDYVNGKRDLTYARELHYAPAEPFEPDVLLHDGDMVRLGGTEIRCMHTPGHTEGCMSYFFRVTDRGQSYLAGMHGGVGINSMERGFLLQHGLPLSLRSQFFEGLRRLRSLPVDLMLGNHPDQNDTEAKALRCLPDGGNPFVCPEEWSRFLSTCAGRLEAMLREEENEI